jgi:hypothetical protein
MQIIGSDAFKVIEIESQVTVSNERPLLMEMLAQNASKGFMDEMRRCVIPLDGGPSGSVYNGSYSLS